LSAVLVETLHPGDKSLTSGRENDRESVIINEVQLLLAEKGTSLKASQFPHENPQARRVLH